jgi:DNA repair protein RecO (recombination protein O)
MSRQRSLQAFILKRQDFGESDQIITLFSKEEGKVRALVKAAKLPTSKLQPILQPLFETSVTMTGNSNSPGLAKVIGAQLIKAYSGILESESKLGAWYMASELIIRALPDSAPNEPLYSELEKYASFLHNQDLDAAQVKHSTTQFQIKSLSTLGLGIKTVSNVDSNLWFSLDRGGFSLDDSADSIPISLPTYKAFRDMVTKDYRVSETSEGPILAPLYSLVNRFVTYQLEREIKSQQYMANN